MKLSNTGYGWVFSGDSVPMQLTGKAFADRYAAVRAAERIGYVCMANGEVLEDESATQKQLDRRVSL